MLPPLLDWERVNHGIKTALACLIGFAIIRLFSFEISQWVIITIVVVMCAQLSVGSVIQKSYMRFLGTLTGSIIAALTIIFFGQDEVAYATVIALSATFFGYVATGEKTYAEIGSLGVVTVIIILIGKDPTLRSALDRFLEISIGILIAALVSQFFFPVHARKHLRELQAKTIRQLRTFYLVTQVKDVDRPEDYLKLEEDIAKLLIKQRQLSVEAARELMGEEFKKIRFQQVLRAERGILRSITMMHYINKRFEGMAEVFFDKVVFQEFRENVSVFLEQVATRLEHKEQIQLTLPNVAPLENYIYGLEKNVPSQDFKYMSAYLFSIEMLVDYLKMLLATAE